eukprot:1797483-Amphidinium_carterae.1
MKSEGSTLRGKDLQVPVMHAACVSVVEGQDLRQQSSTVPTSPSTSHFASVRVVWLLVELQSH